jgi:exportin-1
LLPPQRRSLTPCVPGRRRLPHSEFGLINELGEYVLTHSQKPLLIQTTLTTLHAYLSWVPLGYIFESTLVETLLKLFPTLEFRNVALQCLAEIGALNVGAIYDQHFQHLYTVFITSLQVRGCAPPSCVSPSA